MSLKKKREDRATKLNSYFQSESHEKLINQYIRAYQTRFIQFCNLSRILLSIFQVVATIQENVQVQETDLAISTLLF